CPALRLHRGEREATSGAYGHRGGDRRRSRAGPDPAGPRRDLEGPGAGRGRDRTTARLRDPGAGEHGNHRAGWLSEAGWWDTDRLRSAEWTGRPDGRVRLRGLSHRRRIRP